MKWSDIVDGTAYPATVLDCAGAKVEARAGRPFRCAEYREIQSGGGVNRLFLAATPLRGVNSISMLSDGKETTLSGTALLLDVDRGQISFKDKNKVFAKGTDNITVIYQGGYTTNDLPEEVREAVVEVAQQITTAMVSLQADATTAAANVEVYEPTAKVLLDPKKSLVAGTATCL